MQIEKIDTFSGHKGGVYSLEGGKSTSVLYSGASDGVLVQWNLQKPDVGKGLAQFSKGIFAIKYIEETNQIWVATHLDGIHVIDLTSLQKVHSKPMPQHSIFTFELINGILVAGNSAGFVYLYDVKNFELIKEIQVSNSSIRKILKMNQNQLLITGADGLIRLLDINGSLISSFQAHQQTVFSMAFSEISKSLISVGKDAKVKKWKYKEDEFYLDQELVGHIFPIHDIVLNQEKRLFATSSMDKTIKIWDLEQFKLLKVIDFGRHGGHKNSVNKLYWSDYQDLLVSGSDDKNISVWKLNS